MTAPKIRWGVRITLGDKRVRVTENHKPLAGTFQQALDAMAVFHEREPRLVKLTRKTKPKVVRLKTITWFDNGISPHVGGPGQYWIDNFLHDQYEVNPKPGTSVAATYRLTLEELSDE